MPADSGVADALKTGTADDDPSPAVSGLKPLRVCMVSFYYSPDYSGSAIQAGNLSRHLKPLGVDATIVSANLSASAPYEVVDGFPVYRLPVLRARDLRIPSFWVSLATFLVRQRRAFDLIHAHGVLPHGSASIAGVLIGRPTILKVAMANSDIAFDRQGRVAGSLNRFMARRFDAYIATTEAIADEFASQGLDTSRVHRIPNGVDTVRCAPLSAPDRDRMRHALGLPDGPLVSYVGILNQRKNVDGILRIWRSAVQQGAPGHLVLVGPGPEGAGFAATVRDHLDDPRLAGRVTLTGYRENVVQYLQASDAFLFPSMQEGMPNVVLEAMACGVTPMVSASAGVDAVVRHGHNGFALPWKDESGFARLLGETLTSPDRLRAMGAEARRTAETQYALSTVAARYRHLYDDLLARRTSR